MQHIRFGSRLDGERGWHAHNALGDSTLGPLGFLTLLETQLGLSRKQASTAERVVQWRARLAACRTGARFYERSFEADEFGTAATLLQWRDTWIEHGWNRQAPAGASARLTDMADLEATAGGVAPCVGERLGEIAAALRTHPVQIAAVELVEPLAGFPATWRAVLAQLPITEPAAAAHALAAYAREGTFLKDLQRALFAVQAGKSPAPLPWRTDGSVRIVRAESALAAAEWLASDAGQRPGADRLLVCEQRGGLLDAALSARDQPLYGLTEPSAFRPALQVLPLVLRLLWDPLDFRALLQFLTHPVTPLPRFAQGRLAQKMASRPGLGGEEWHEALAAIATHYGERAVEIRRRIGYWLEHVRYPPERGAPLAAVVERVGAVAGFFQPRLIAEDPLQRASAAAGFQQAQAVRQSLETLQEQGEERIGREALDKLVAQATAAGSEGALMGAQAGAGGRVSDPGAVIETFEEVCWWGMCAVPLVVRYPWSHGELASLAAAGAALPATGGLLSRQAAAWCAPLWHARERLTLVILRNEEPHPLWLTLESVMAAPVIEDIEAALGDSAPAPHVTPVPHRALPARRRWWQVPVGAIRGWHREASYSSLNLFIYNPYQWALQYPAQLQTSALLDLPNESQLFGNVAHRVVERLYRQPAALGWTVAQVENWFDGALAQILMEEGAILFMPGRAAAREMLRWRVRRALRELHRHLLAAGVTAVEAEKRLQADTPLGALAGSSDLLVTFGNGSRAVIDMKWSGTRWRQAELQDQCHIQLAIYARMVAQNTQDWPHVAYFILRDARLLTTAEQVFPGVTAIRVPGAATSQVWERLAVSWSWRRIQIEAGRLEVVLEDVEATADSGVPDLGLAAKPPDDRFNPFGYLAGWAEEA